MSKKHTEVNLFKVGANYGAQNVNATNRIRGWIYDTQILIFFKTKNAFFCGSEISFRCHNDPLKLIQQKHFGVKKET